MSWKRAIKLRQMFDGRHQPDMRKQDPENDDEDIVEEGFKRVNVSNWKMVPEDKTDWRAIASVPMGRCYNEFRKCHGT